MLCPIFDFSKAVNCFFGCVSLLIASQKPVFLFFFLQELGQGREMRHHNRGRQTLEKVDDEGETESGGVWKVASSHGVSGSDTAAIQRTVGLQIITLCCAY